MLRSSPARFRRRTSNAGGAQSIISSDGESVSGVGREQTQCCCGRQLLSSRPRSSKSRRLRNSSMEEDTEVLDWGNEDDESHAVDYYRDQQKQETRSRDVRNVGVDEDDAVSLGDDEDEEFYAYKSATQDDNGNGPPSTPRASSSSQQTLNGKPRDDYRESSATPHKPTSRQNESSELRRTQSLGKMTHALPPKPSVAPPPFVPNTPTPLPLARAMVTQRRDKKPNGHGKSTGNSHSGSSLPPDWEERWPSGGGHEPYYYNVRTHTSQWTQPEGPSSRMASPDKEAEASSHGMMADSPMPNSADQGALGLTKRESKPRLSPDAALSYEDRHYRPGGDSPSTGPNENLDRRDSYAALPPRPASPRSADARRPPRSLTPPPYRRDSPGLERAGRSRRERSPPPPDRSGRRDRSSSLIEPQERAWVPRNVSPPSTTTGRSDNRNMASRGRHERANAQPPSHSSTVTQGSRNNASEWSASSTLSASYHVLHRARRLRSSRGGGCSNLGCLEKPRELSCAASPYPFFHRPLPVINTWSRLVDSFIFCFPFVSSLYICIPIRS